MTQNLSQIIRTIVLSTILGFGSGVIGTALTTNALSDYALSLGALSSPARLSEEQPRSLPQSYSEVIREITESVLPSVAEFYQVGSFEKSVSSGAVLTSDGWIMTMFEVLPSASNLSVVIGGKTYPVEKLVSDSATGAVFAKINSSNLPVFAFGKGFDLTAGDQLFITSSPRTIFSESVVELIWPTGAQRSDVPGRHIVTASDRFHQRGAPVVNIYGDLVGIIDGANIVPTDTVLTGFNSLLREGKISRPSLGVIATDLSRTLGLDKTVTKGHTTGAVLIGLTSIKKGSSAALAGLVPGDIILMVNSTPIDSTHSLDELILSHNPGDTITLQVASTEGERELVVTLSTF